MIRLEITRLKLTIACILLGALAPSNAYAEFTPTTLRLEAKQLGDDQVLYRESQRDIPTDTCHELIASGAYSPNMVQKRIQKEKPDLRGELEINAYCNDKCYRSYRIHLK